MVECAFQRDVVNLSGVLLEQKLSIIAKDTTRDEKSDDLSLIMEFGRRRLVREMGNLELLRILYGRALWLSVAQGFL
jgi:hypothetical protein